MKLNHLFSALLGIMLTMGFTACEGEKDLNIIEGELPIKTGTLYMVGDATPNGWDIGNPTALQASADDALTFTWEGELRTGELKLCLTTGSWDAPFIRPEVNGTEIGKTDISNAKFAMHAGDPDDKWRVAAAGTYRLTFDLRNWTMSTAFLAEPEAPSKEPILAENVFMVGDATPAGWNIDAPTQLTRQSQYIFIYEGTLAAGEMKAYTQSGDWGAPAIRPTFGGCKIGRSGVESADFIYTTGPDDKWQIEEAGQYRLTFDLEHYTLAAEYLGEIPAQTNTPIEAEAVYIVGDATPNGWSIDAPTQLTKQSQYIFVYEGELVPGELKACTQTGDWGQPFVRPDAEGVKINKDGVESPDFVFTESPDNKWKVEAPGNYRLTFDLEHYTLKAEFLGEIEEAKDPIVADNVWMIGTATPGGWSLDDAAQYTKDANNKYLFTWEGDLKVGTFKACTKKDFSAAFIRPSSANVAITKQGVAADDFVFTTSPDDQWEVKEAGKYRITLDLEHYTIKVEKKD